MRKTQQECAMRFKPVVFIQCCTHVLLLLWENLSKHTCVLVHHKIISETTGLSSELPGFWCFLQFCVNGDCFQNVAVHMVNYLKTSNWKQNRTSPLFIVGLTYRDKQPSTLTFRPTGNLEWPISLPRFCMFLNCGRKPEYPERTHSGRGSNI